MWAEFRPKLSSREFLKKIVSQLLLHLEFCSNFWIGECTGWCFLFFMNMRRKPDDRRMKNFTPNVTDAGSICTRILKYRVWKIEFDELDFLSISNSNVGGYTGSKNLVQTRQKFQFIKLDFSNSIVQSPSADRYRARSTWQPSFICFRHRISLLRLHDHFAS